MHELFPFTSLRFQHLGKYPLKFWFSLQTTCKGNKMIFPRLISKLIGLFNPGGEVTNVCII